MWAGSTYPEINIMKLGNVPVSALVSAQTEALPVILQNQLKEHSALSPHVPVIPCYTAKVKSLFSQDSTYWKVISIVPDRDCLEKWCPMTHTGTSSAISHNCT